MVVMETVIVGDPYGWDRFIRVRVAYQITSEGTGCPTGTPTVGASPAGLVLILVCTTLITLGLA